MCIKIINCKYKHKLLGKTFILSNFLFMECANKQITMYNIIYRENIYNIIIQKMNIPFVI